MATLPRLAVLLLLPGCTLFTGDLRVAGDGATDGAPADLLPDGAVADLAIPDQTVVDLAAIPDGASIDLAAIDLTAIDLTAIDLATPDLALPLCDAMEKPDEKKGVFVSAAGGSPTGKGDAVSPLDNVAAALALAKVSGRSTVYLDEGTYAEMVDLVDTPTGVFLDGGWKYTGLAWERDCSPTMRDRTLIRPKGPIGVRATDVTHLSGLSNLSISTAAKGVTAADAPGASRIALLVRGDGSAIKLRNVRVLPGDGDDGGAASGGTIGGAPAMCDGTKQCTVLPDGGTLDGPEGKAGVEAISGGGFTRDGYTPADGAPGAGPGADGKNGSPGEATVTLFNCNTGCTCPTCFTSYNNSVTANGGTCGCGGRGGGPGKAGRGGGASVGILVVGKNAAVSLDGCGITAGAGGAGSAGGMGGLGSKGTAGAPGTATTCYLSDCIGGCGNPKDCRYNEGGNKTVVPQRKAGSVGGTGGPGGIGGGGAGGPSYGVVTVGGALVDLAGATSIVAGPAERAAAARSRAHPWRG